MGVQLKGKERNLYFYDFEVLSSSICEKTGESYWCVVIIDYDTGNCKIIRNDKDELRQFYKQTKDDIYIGFNCRNYDQFIFKGLLMNMDAGIVNDKLIRDNIKGHNVVKGAYKIPFYTFDIMPNPPQSLKAMEAFMGDDIQESSVPFDIDRPITIDEEKDLVKYCIHDVQETIRVFDNLRQEFDSQLALIEAFDLDMSMFTKTKAQLAAEILEAERHGDRGDEFDFIYPDTLILDKYSHVKDWYDNFDSYTDEKGKTVKLETKIAGVDTVYGIGGIHSAIPNIDETGIILACDIASMYPALIIEYGLMSRNVPGIEKYLKIRSDRLIMKANKDPRQQPYKIVLNATFGTFKDQFNAMYDKRMSNSICVSGMLLLTDLAEKLEPHCKILQKNTDGIYMKVEKEEDIEVVKSIAKEWEKRSRLDLEWDEYSRLIQKDVNNYILVTKDGEYKSKGAYTKELSNVDYDLPIINKAIVNYFTKNIPIETTINNCDELREFQKVVKKSSAYTYVKKDVKYEKVKEVNPATGRLRTVEKLVNDGKILTDKTYRVFASTRDDDWGLFKQKVDGNPEKFANTPVKCFVDNGDINGKLVPDYLDKSYYITLAQERIYQYKGLDKNGKPKKSKKKAI